MFHNCNTIEWELSWCPIEIEAEIEIEVIEIWISIKMSELSQKSWLKNSDKSPIIHLKKHLCLPLI